MRYAFIAVTAAVAGLSWAGQPPPVEINEWPVPWEATRPRDPYVDDEGRVWFVGQRGDYVAYLLPGAST